MESGTKQNAVSFSNGMSNVPNDLLCGDDSCSEVVGLTSENGEMRPIQNAKEEFSLSDIHPKANRLLYVHQTQNGKVYIFSTIADTTLQELYFFTDSSRDYTIITQLGYTSYINIDDVSLTSVGNTLIMRTPYEMKYFLWTGSNYNSLGSKIPSPRPLFCLDGYEDIYGWFPVSNDVVYNQNGVWLVKYGQDENWNNVAIGAYAEQLEKVREKNAFYCPFFALMALELYDGSYYMSTAPVALYPNIETRYWGYFMDVPPTLYCGMKGQHLKYKQMTDYSAWSDIVKNVTIFVTDGVSPCDSTVDALRLGRDNLIRTASDSSDFENNRTSIGFLGTSGTLTRFNPYLPGSFDDAYQLLRKKDISEIIREMSELRVFYRLCDIGTEQVANDWLDTASLISPHTLQNLTTQTRLDVDGGEYFDHAPMKAGYAYSYNGRLNLANVERGFFDGFEQFISMNNDASTHTVDVAIETPNGWHIVSKSGIIGSVGHYFYYPDPRARYVRIDSNLVFKLEEHKGLHGAFCIYDPLHSLESDSYNFPTQTFSGDEPLPNKVLVSEVDNPFVFRARGYNTVGNGEVMAIVSNTTALSEGQFGQHPLLAFSTDGIWALGTNSTGTYSTVSPLSREVCNNADSVTQTDSAVFFTSEKGLMMIIGNQVRCVSEQMNGKTEEWGNTLSAIDFKTFLSGCSIGYDYRDSMLWIFNNKVEVNNSVVNWHYVFNIKTGTFAKMHNMDAWVHEVSDYPDTLLQSDLGNVYSLLNKDEQNADDDNYYGSITTRPMKFGNAMTLKSIRQIKHLKNMAAGASLGLEVFASNDGRQWVSLMSLRGKPWRLYRLRYTFNNMKATDRFIGSVFVTQERRTEKLR